MKRPMIFWVILFVLGEVLGHPFTLNQMVFVTAGTACALMAVGAVHFRGKGIRRPLFGREAGNRIKGSRFFLLENGSRWVWWAGGIFFMLGIVCMMNVKEKIRFCENLAGKEIAFTGVVKQRSEKKNGIQYVVGITVLNERRCHMNVVMVVKDTELMPGDYVKITGIGAVFNHASNPGGYDEEAYQYGHANLLKAEQAKVSDNQPQKFPVRYWLYCARAELAAAYQKLFHEREASLAAAMVLGDKAELDADIKELYQRNGIAHLIAISGLHIAMIGGTLYHLLRRLLGNYSVPAALGGLFIILYGVMTGLSGATLRAVIMLLAMLGADVCGRHYDALSAAALALFVMLVQNPYQLFQAGFLLSFGAVLGITLFLPVWKTYAKKAPKWLDGLGVSISVQVVTLPIMLWYFYEVPVWGFLLNLIVVPLMSVLLACLILCGVSGLFFLPAGQVLAVPAEWIFKLYEGLCRGSEALPFHTLCTGRPSVRCVILYYLLMGLFLSVSHGKWKPSKKVAVLCSLTVLLMFAAAVVIPGKLKVCVLDVGQGDGIYIRTPGRMHILMDGGSSTEKNVGKYILTGVVKYHGGQVLDYVFVSHSDSDHYSGILELMQDGSLQIKNLILPAVTNPDEAYHVLEQTAKEAGSRLIYMQAGDSIQIDGVDWQCLNPEQKAYLDKNAGSLVFSMTYKEFDMLFTGDMNEQVEQRLLKEGVLQGRSIEVIKVSHHGSATASSQEFLSQIKPETSIVSVAERNRYGHPAREVMERLIQFSDRIYLTKENGAVTIDTDGKHYRVSTHLARCFAEIKDRQDIGDE